VTWTLRDFDYAGHEVEIEYTDFDNKVTARIKGPRSGGTDRDFYTSNPEIKIDNKIPFRSPTANTIKKAMWEASRKARKEIDNTISAHHKKHDNDYQ